MKNLLLSLLPLCLLLPARNLTALEFRKADVIGFFPPVTDAAFGAGLIGLRFGLSFLEHIRVPYQLYRAPGSVLYFRPAIINLEQGALAIGLPFLCRVTRNEFPFSEAYYSINLFTIEF